MSELQFVGGTTVEHLMLAFNESSFNSLLGLKLNDLKLFDNTLKEQHTFQLLKNYISKNNQMVDLNLKNTGLNPE